MQFSSVDDDRREGKGNTEWQSKRIKPLIAFSSGPYAACLADGSEYTGEYAEKVSIEQMIDFHRRKLQVCSHQSQYTCSEP